MIVSCIIYIIFTVNNPYHLIKNKKFFSGTEVLEFTQNTQNYLVNSESFDVVIKSADLNQHIIRNFCGTVFCNDSLHSLSAN